MNALGRFFGRRLSGQERLKSLLRTLSIGQRRDALLLALILALTAIKGVLWSAAVPLWQGPDEDRHFSTVQFIAEHGRLPGEGEIYHDDENVIAGELAEVSRLWYNPELRQTFGPGDEGPNEAAIAALDPRLRTSTERGKVTLALHLPPLYYFLGALFYLPARGGDLLARVFAVRRLSVLLGVGTVACAYLIAREVFPKRRSMWFTVPVLVSFQPMFTLICAVVNTDAMVIAVFSALVYLTLRALKAQLTVRLGLGIGLLVGAGLLTKPFILDIVVPLAAVAAWEALRVRRDRARLARLALALGTLAAVAIALWAPWVVHSARLGNSPFYADELRVGQLTLEHPFYDYRLGPYLVDYVRSLLGGTWASFWGDFGWIEAPLDTPCYYALYGVCALAVVGLAAYAGRRARRRAWDAEAGLLGYLALCAASVAATRGAMNYYAWRTRGAAGGIQGRYYLGAVIPLMTLLAAGPIDLLPKRWRPAGHWLLCWGMIVLHGVALFQVVLPRYYF
jgi:4-amino-4-deoxy-L-arabinose transferase-like glycosyltransferase